MKLPWFVPFFLGLLFLAPPAPGGEEPEGRAPAALAASTRAFGAELYRAVANRPGNLFLSPYSVVSALAMVREGAKGKTSAEMDRVLALPGDRTAAWVALANALEPGSGKGTFSLQVANAVWAQEGLALVPSFVRVLTTRYGAPPVRIDFAKTEAARRAINDWVSKQTKARIENIVPEGLPTPDTLLALANAIWFKAAWKDPFEERRTRDAPFYAPGGEVTARMMHRRGSFAYAETGKTQIVEIPYVGGETSMLVVLPKARDGLADVEAELSGETLASWTEKLETRAVELKLPKFSFTWATDLADILAAMGMPSAFDASRADFTGMTTEEPLQIGAVLHKAFVAVDEAGTEAAAATVMMMPKGVQPRDAVAFTADRPFLFLVRHRETGAILFLGRVVDPTDAG